MTRIGVDIASGETSPHELFLSLKEYAQREKEDTLFVFVNRQDVANQSEVFSELDNLKIIQVSQTIEMEDSPIKGVKKKRDSSIVVGLKYLKDNKIDFFFSPGNTGAVIYAASEIIGKTSHVEFPAIGTMMPNIHGDILLLDSGASPMIDEDRGLELSLMGSIYFENILKHSFPPLGILNLGKEWYKGSKWVRKLDSILKKDRAFNYFGFVEGFDLFTSECRVFITGGYTGNILLKGIEGVYFYVRHLLKDKAQDKAGAQKLSELLKQQIHYSRVGTGIVMGVKKDVFIGHGVTSPEALQSALTFAKNIVTLKLPQKIETAFRRRGFMSRLVRRRRKK